MHKFFLCYLTCFFVDTQNNSNAAANVDAKLLESIALAVVKEQEKKEDSVMPRLSMDDLLKLVQDHQKTQSDAK